METAADGTYTLLCDTKTNFSFWSEALKYFVYTWSLYILSFWIRPLLNYMVDGNHPSETSSLLGQWPMYVCLAKSVLN